MRIAWLLVVSCRLAFADASVVGARRATVPSGSHRGQLLLRYGFFEGGVSAASDTRYELDLELVTRQTSAELRVRGHGEHSVSFRRHDSTTPSQDTRFNVDEKWTGELAVVDGETRLRLRGRQVEQELSCAISKNVLRCDPTTARKGFPWNDRVPAYLRVPLVVAITGNLRAEIDVRVPIGDEQPRSRTPVTILPAR